MDDHKKGVGKGNRLSVYELAADPECEASIVDKRRKNYDPDQTPMQFISRALCEAKNVDTNIWKAMNPECFDATEHPALPHSVWKIDI
jgi:hypothetical protein